MRASIFFFFFILILFFSFFFSFFLSFLTSDWYIIWQFFFEGQCTRYSVESIKAFPSITLLFRHYLFIIPRGIDSSVLSFILFIRSLCALRGGSNTSTNSYGHLFPFFWMLSVFFLNFYYHFLKINYHQY